MMGEVVAALARVASAASAAEGPEAALWCVTHTLPALLGDPTAAMRPNAFRDAPPPVVGTAAAAFLRTPDGLHHLVAAPVNFAPEQHHELVDITLGHPAEVARTRRPLLLRDTALHGGFVKILQSFRAGSSMFAPLLWRGEYLGVLICANAARCTYGEHDLLAHQAFAGLAAACFVAQGGPEWLVELDLRALPRRDASS